MTFEITKRPQAERDIEECFVFIGEDNLDVGINFLVAVEDTIEIIQKNPYIGKIREFDDPQINTLRMMLVKNFHNYQIYYTIKNETIEIIRVFHGARQISDVFE